MSRREARAAELPQAVRKQRTDSPNGGIKAFAPAKDSVLWANDGRDGIDSIPSAPKGWESIGELGRTSHKNSQDDAVFIPSTKNKSNEDDAALIPSTKNKLWLATQANERRTATPNAQSNDANEKRIAILNAQINHAKLLASAKDAVNSRKAGHTQRLGQKHAAELQHVKFANEQIFESLRVDLRAEVDRLTKEVKSVPAVASGLLNSDDRALAELNELSLSHAVRQEDALDVDELQGRVDRLTHALQHFRAGAVKDRLDRIYLESFHSADLAGDAQNAHDVSEPTHETAKEELNSLYEEIDDMVTMVVAHDHGNALRAALQDFCRAQTQETQAAEEKVYTRLCSLTEALEGLAARAERLQVQRHNLHELEAQVRLLEANNSPRKDAAKVVTRAESNDTTPAADALLQHLSLSTHAHKLSEIADLHTLLDDVTTKFEQQSAQNVAEILDTSALAATRRRVALEKVAEALATDGNHELALRALAESIAVTRAKIEDAQN
ncbi:hypothetical protein PV04_07611 [Phialophora macrospora]|uniref:Uncharacterized protein n=1 Tax=Phialophora macrospora TaxID=1851006 RepID=A0A0D2DT74_9EURO|nr:hypothetical protein PV04_07611 [Phialophora macrospora]